MNLDNTTGGRE